MVKADRNKMIGLFAGCVILGTLLSFLVSEEYESVAVISIGKITYINSKTHLESDVYFEDPAVIAQRMRMGYKANENSKGESSAVIASVEVDRNAPYIITVRTRAKTPKEAQECLSEVMSSLLNKHTLIYDETIRNLESRMAISEKQDESAILNVEIARRLLEGKEQLELKIMPTEVLHKPLLPALPLKDKKKYIIGGIMAGIGGVFLFGLWKRIRTI